MPLANATEYEHLYRGMPDDRSLYVCCKLACYDKINIILTRMFCKPFKDLWLLYTPPALTSKSYTFCPHSVWMYLRKNNDDFPTRQKLIILRK